MKMIEDRTRIGTRNCITFKKQTNENNFLEIKNGVGCNSFVGKLKANKPQIVNLDRSLNCISKATITHELVHALGLDHEHNRPDRDHWVKIEYKNILGGESNNDFKSLDWSEFQDLGTPYDYESVMHYHYNAHAINKSSITIKAIKFPFEIKINENLSDIDVFEIRKLYNCKPGILNLILFST